MDLIKSPGLNPKQALHSAWMYCCEDTFTEYIKRFLGKGYAKSWHTQVDDKLYLVEVKIKCINLNPTELKHGRASN